MLIPILQSLYWPAYWTSIALGIPLTILALYRGVTVLRFGAHTPAPESKLACVAGWVTMIALAITLTPAMAFFGKILFALCGVSTDGLADLVSDPQTFMVHLDLLRGTRILSGDAGYTRLLGESMAFAALGGRAALLGIMMWPKPPRRDRHLLDAVLRATSPYDLAS